MTNVSSKPLSHDRQVQLFDELAQLLSKLSSSHIQSFLGDLLGAEEQIMIAKRFAAIILLEQGNSIYKVSKVLHLSTSTVTNLDIKRKSGSYKNITRWLKKDTVDVKKFLDILDSILTVGGILPRYGEQYKALK